MTSNYEKSEARKRVMDWFHNCSKAVVRFDEVEDRVYKETKGFCYADVMSVLKNVIKQIKMEEEIV